MALKRAEKIGKGRLGKLELGIKIYDLKRNTLEILDEVLRTTGYLDLYDPRDEEDVARLENIKELRSVAEEYSNINDFLENVALAERESKKSGWSGDRGAITLMTLHAAKGLEFDTVFLVGMEEGLFPHSRTLMNPDEMEEERRLAYVGITRARKKLYITYARRRLYFGMRSNNPVSRFVSEMPENLIETSFDLTLPIGKRTKVGSSWGFDENGKFKWAPRED